MQMSTGRMPRWISTKKRVRFNPDKFDPFTSQHRFEPTQPPPTQKENTWHFVSPVFGYCQNFLTKQTQQEKNIQQPSLKQNSTQPTKPPLTKKKKRPPPKTALYGVDDVPPTDGCRVAGRSIKGGEYLEGLRL